MGLQLQLVRRWSQINIWYECNVECESDVRGMICDVNVFTFGRPPSVIDIMIHVKGLSFKEAFTTSQIAEMENLKVRFMGLAQLLKAKKTTGRHKDLDDIEILFRVKNGTV
jgi:hypothetical protein